MQENNSPGGLLRRAAVYHVHFVVDNVGHAVGNFFAPCIVIMHVVAHIFFVVALVDGAVIVVDKRDAAVQNRLGFLHQIMI